MSRVSAEKVLAAAVEKSEELGVKVFSPIVLKYTVSEVKVLPPIVSYNIYMVHIRSKGSQTLSHLKGCFGPSSHKVLSCHICQNIQYYKSRDPLGSDFQTEEIAGQWSVDRQSFS